MKNSTLTRRISKSLSKVSGSATLRASNGSSHIITRDAPVGLGTTRSIMHLSLETLSQVHQLKSSSRWGLPLPPLSSCWVFSLDRALMQCRSVTDICYRTPRQRSSTSTLLTSTSMLTAHAMSGWASPCSHSSTATDLSRL